MMQLPALSFAPLADSALLICLGDGQHIDPDVVAAVWALTAALDARDLAGVDDIVPAYATILIAFDPGQTDPWSLEREIREIAGALPRQPATPEREVVVPVAYGGEYGPDLADVAAHTGLTPDDVVTRHAAAAYHVACGGFAPGWDYLMGLPPELATPRLPNPRMRIPPGSVGIGGIQTGIYPLETPGGWRLIGRTPLRLFDPDRADPFLLHPGDRVRFRRIRDDEFGTTSEVDASGSDISGTAASEGLLTPSHSESAGKSLSEIGARDPKDSIRVVHPGMLTTVQDLGRPGMARYGVAPGGALDRTALILGNRLVGNEPGEAGLEITLLGPTLVFGGPTTIALTGADLGARLNGSAVPLWQPVPVAEGDQLSFQPAAGNSSGARAYLCLAGGLAIDPVLDSRSTDLVGHFGGFHGRALLADDEIPLRAPAPAPDSLLRRRLASAPPTYESSIVARATFGPQRDRFTDDGIATFLGREYAVSTKANRTGVRLSGPAIAHVTGADLVSEGIAHGAVQVPGDGQPIVLLAARQTVGGYVKIATVIGVDLDRFAQLRPGATVRFAEVAPQAAREETLRSRAATAPEAIVETPRYYAGWESDMLAQARGEASDVGNNAAWNPTGVIRVIEAAQAAGISSFHLEIAEIGLKLELVWGGEGVSSPAATNQQASGPELRSSRETTITAPVLGVLYRRSAPDQPVLVEEGNDVAAGQTLALLEVMKTYHEVLAPHAGKLIAFLVEDGRFVEYGQPIARLVPAENDDATT